MRVNAYIDGFNLYHSILSFNEPRLANANLEIKKAHLLNSLLPNSIRVNNKLVNIPKEYLVKKN